MRDKTTQAAGRDNGSPLAGVKRLELLSWRFSQTEIESLSLLQLVHRQQPNVLDIPLAESRLQFARWLVKHGRLNEGLAPASEETLCAAEEKYPSPDREGAPALPQSRAVPVPVCDRAPDAPDAPEAGSVRQEYPEYPEETEDAEAGHRVRRGVWSWLRRGMAKCAAGWRELTRPDYMPYGPGSWGTWGYYGSYDPYGPRNPWGDPRGISDPYWYWMHHRHDD